MQNVIKLACINDINDEISLQAIPITYAKLFKNSFAKVQASRLYQEAVGFHFRSPILWIY